MSLAGPGMLASRFVRAAAGAARSGDSTETTAPAAGALRPAPGRRLRGRSSWIPALAGTTSNGLPRVHRRFTFGVVAALAVIPALAGIRESCAPPRESAPNRSAKGLLPRLASRPPRSASARRTAGLLPRLASSLLLTAACAALAAGPALAAADYGAVGYVEIDDIIDRYSDRYLARVIEQARAEDIDTLLVRIDTDGGEVHHARTMFKRILDLEADGIRTVAFIDFRAISAGALIAYAHEEVYLGETASIGDIGVVFQSPEGEIKYAPEKFETIVRTLLVQAAEQRGWNRGMLLKMTAHKQSLYRVTLAGGSVDYVIEDDLPEFLARHPDIDRDDPKQVIVYRGPDRLLTLTGLEAMKLGMASGNVADLDAMHERLGVSADAIVDLSPRGAERAAWALSRFAPALAGLAVLFLLFELKTPGVGLWAGLAALLGAGFLLAQYSLDLMENFELLLIVIGVGLLVAEMFTMAGGGLLAALGAATGFTGLVLAFLPNELAFDLDDPIFLDALRDAAFGGATAVGIVAAGAVLAIRYLPRSTALHRRIAVEGEVTATSTGEIEARTGALLGKRGKAAEALHPSGTVRIGDESIRARAEHGAYIAAGTAVEVVSVEFGEVVVRSAAGAASSTREHGGG